MIGHQLNTLLLSRGTVRALIVRVTGILCLLYWSTSSVAETNFGSGAESDAAIENATPSDDLNELDQGADQVVNFNSAPVNEFPAEENNPNNDFDADISADPSAANPAPLKNPASEVVPEDHQVTAAQLPAPAELKNTVVPVSPMTTQASGPLAPVIATVPEAIPLAPETPPNAFAGAAAVPGTLQQVAAGEAPEDYVVQPGDTLYDICDQLLDEGGYWPKLWAMNPDIKNPHFIFPDMKLRFYPGDDENPPYLQVLSEDDVIPIDKGELDEKELLKEPVQLQIPTDTLTLAEESPIEIIGAEQVGQDETGALTDEILSGGRLYAGDDIRVQVPGFIFSQERETLGTVVSGRENNVNLSSGQQAFIEAEDSLSAGTLYTVLRPGAEIENQETGDFVGYRYTFVANIHIDRSLEKELYVGTVRDSRLGLYKGDILVSYISTFRTVPNNDVVGALSSAQASIVGFQYDDQDIGGAGHYAFIDRGSQGGISPGMYLQIFSTPGPLAAGGNTDELPIDYIPIGVIRIIDVTDVGAVGYIVRNTSEMRRGDRVGRG